MEQKLNVYEMRVKLYLLQDIPFKELQNAVANLWIQHCVRMRV